MATTADDWSIYWRVPVAYAYDPKDDDYDKILARDGSSIAAGYDPDGDDYHKILVDSDGIALAKGHVSGTTYKKILVDAAGNVIVKGYVSGTTYAKLKVDSDGYARTKLMSMIEFWSAPLAVLNIDATPADHALPDVALPDLSDVTILKAYAMMKISALGTETGGWVYPVSTTYIQVDKAAAGYINAIQILNGAWWCPALGYTNLDPWLIGDVDISSRVALNATTNFKWADAATNTGSINYYGIRTGVRLIIR